MSHDPLEHERAIGRILTVFAEYYDKTLSDIQLEMYTADLIDLPPADLKRACQTYRRNPANARFPLPSALREIARPENIGDEQHAREAAGRIIAAVSKFGYYRAADAKAWMGPLAWHVVDRQGGWSSICHTLTDDNMGTLQAQWRDLAIATQRRARAGLHEIAPTIPLPAGQERPRGLEQFNPMALLPSKPEGEKS